MAGTVNMYQRITRIYYRASGPRVACPESCGYGVSLGAELSSNEDWPKQGREEETFITVGV